VTQTDADPNETPSRVTRRSTAFRGEASLGVAVLAAFVSVVPDRQPGDSLALGLVVTLWCTGLGAGAIGAWWTSGTRRRLLTGLAVLLGVSAARTIAASVPVSGVNSTHVALLTALATGPSLAALFLAIGRANPDYANTPVAWRKTGLPHHPFVATIDGEHWQVRVNTRPGAPRYTLLVNDLAVLELESWPMVWNPNGSGRAI
jgi:hypothetical protein